MVSHLLYKCALVFTLSLSPIFGQAQVPTTNTTQSSATSASATPSSCTNYPTNGICSAYINYSVYTKGLPIPLIEQQIALLKNISEGFKDIAPTCVDAYYRYSCSFAYPRCDNNEPTMGCISSCEEVYHQCKNIFMLTGLNALPDCKKTSPITQQPLSSSSKCNAIASKLSNTNAHYNLSYIPDNFVVAQCPAPFVKDAGYEQPGSATNTAFCKAGCCLPCPQQNFFYPTDWTIRAFLATDIVRCISAVLSLILTVSYLVLPDKRRHPSLLILNFSISIFLFSMVSFFSVNDPKRIQCANPASVSSQDNNPLCAVQGAILIFSSLATCCWSAALILNLHLHTVWKVNFFTNRYYILNTFCWGYPIVFMSLTLGLHKVKFEFANLCLVSVDKIFELFFYPMAAIVCPAFLVHIATFIYIARMAFREGIQSDISQSASQGTTNLPITSRKHKHVITAVQIQWRAILLAILSSGTVVFYWIFYFTQIHKMVNLKNDDTIKLSWIECMISPDGGQDNCTYIIKDKLPPFALMVAAETLVSTIGIWLFVIFGKASLWREWGDFFYDLQVYIKTRGLEKNNDQFFAL
ncbi:hypothetical protein BCV72DRAFT_295993 [Rhizopus microsporus var. microsporus]|uniref:G-protein coupled receptors family 2 profile 2 domain-containing protein n=2 Tax=Rhizopus microsporus TaxID=58291 RepID=A0A2G4SUG3_RHIZD|nr:uncharacterized protein RHIMIDRAFT_313227 [Rhizopus microsporus ATCC 52813]ORE03657.1 hypothetical protein BCV72DRAFT_295993 [Rhizopus microsporus var. microsporus]PHZ12409.1 hypothetical protein RHIMIDRAFT_313227 [Rhizopus microsporus ATCC 52813]